MGGKLKLVDFWSQFGKPNTIQSTHAMIYIQPKVQVLSFPDSSNDPIITLANSVWAFILN